MQLVIHASNVRGLGAARVTRALVDALQAADPDADLVAVLPESGPLAGYQNAGLRIHRVHRRLPMVVSRVIESLAPQLFFPTGDRLIVLGDVPVRTATPQVVLAQQMHLVAPDVDPHVGTSLRWRTMRGLFALNSRRVRAVLVQTEWMRHGLEATYPALRGRVRLVRQPPPPGSTSATAKPILNGAGKLDLFYPASGYRHKNHRIFSEIPAGELDPIVSSLTLTRPESANPAPVLTWIRCIGEVSPEACHSLYAQSSAVVFPSLIESYGLPLVEGMLAGLPIVAADLPYAREVCGPQGIYFDPMSSRSLVSAIRELHRRAVDGWQPDWSAQLSQLPADWSEVARQFLDAFE